MICVESLEIAYAPKPYYYGKEYTKDEPWMNETHYTELSFTITLSD